jgi:hypothetical protein
MLSVLVKVFKTYIIRSLESSDNVTTPSRILNLYIGSILSVLELNSDSRRAPLIAIFFDSIA